jgi:aryl-alcohol dehydrogenase-like predicted oxidoreductase
MMDVRAESSGLFAEAEARGAGFIARTPLCFGFLTGTIRRDSVFPEGDHRRGWSREQLDNWIDGAADLLEAVGSKPGRAGAHAALRFCLSFPAVSSVIPGILAPSEADANAAASALGPLSRDAIVRVLDINRRREFFVARPRAS